MLPTASQKAVQLMLTSQFDVNRAAWCASQLMLMILASLIAKSMPEPVSLDFKSIVCLEVTTSYKYACMA